MAPSSESRPRSRTVFERGERVMVGGVNSPVRAFKAVGGTPLVIERGAGARVADCDGREYLDYVCSWGAMILGHAHPAVTSAIQDQAARGTSFGMSTELEVELAERICRAIPSIEKIRFVTSGTEATMSAVRLARGFTGRELIVKFEGGYHGHADSFLTQAGSGLMTFGIASSPGVPEALARLTLNVPYNDLDAVETLFNKRGKEIAAIIVEPVAANMGVVPPEEGLLEGLHSLTTKHGALLIFDEVITGFRVSYGGAQALFGIRPDLTILGKIIGGGLPVAAYGGRRDIMERVSPLGPVYQAGTLSGNPLAMRAGIETLKQLQIPGFYEQLNHRAEGLVHGLSAAAAASKLPACVNACGSLLTVFFAECKVRDYATAKQSDSRRFAEFFRAMLDRGVFLPPSQFEAWFLSAAHSDADLERTCSTFAECLAVCQTVQ